MPTVALAVWQDEVHAVLQTAVRPRSSCETDAGSETGAEDKMANSGDGPRTIIRRSSTAYVSNGVTC